MQDSNLDILKIQDERICREKSLFCPSPLYVYIYIYIHVVFERATYVEPHCLQLTQRETVRGRKDHAARRRRREIWTPSGIREEFRSIVDTKSLDILHNNLR